jgi:hypothetical protein
MISITAKFRVKADHIEDWPNITKAFTEGTRAEPGCLWFEWSQRAWTTQPSSCSWKPSRTRRRARLTCPRIISSVRSRNCLLT